MLQTEYVRNLNCNYERILLEKKPEENRYQYCIVTRGGIRGLLPCSLRYINGEAYLYYDISSTQSVDRLYSGKRIGRQWMKDFLWGMRRVRQEMSRFLLDDKNLLWYPQQIFQDLEKNDFYFLYVPYFEGDCGFGELMNYLVESIDYEDDGLVDCVYRMHEQFQSLGEVYLHERIYEDAKRLDVERTPAERPGDGVEGYGAAREGKSGEILNGSGFERRETSNDMKTSRRRETASAAASGESRLDGNPREMRGTWETRETREAREVKETREAREASEVRETREAREAREVRETRGTREARETRESKKGIRYFLEERLKKQREDRENMRPQTQKPLAGYAVAEEPVYAGMAAYASGQEQEDELEELGRTVYMEAKVPDTRTEGLYTEAGQLLVQIDRQTIILGKKKDEADYVINDISVSRMHARITKDRDGIYLEDLNSTNGTFKNGLRLQPYEKRRLEKEDEIRLGKVILLFR